MIYYETSDFLDSLYIEFSYLFYGSVCNLFCRLFLF